MKGITKRWIRLFLTATTLTTALIALSGCNVNAEGKISFKKEINAPSDFFDINDILVYKDKTIINYPLGKEDCISYNELFNTGSMMPTLNEFSTVIKDNCFTEINTGDIISYDASLNKDCDSNSTILHRVISIENIDGINFYRAKGDNNDIKDNCLISREMIKNKVVAIIY